VDAISVSRRCTTASPAFGTTDLIAAKRLLDEIGDAAAD